MKLFTGEGFPSERTLAVAGVIIGALTLLVIAIDHMDNKEHRKVARELAEAQLKDLKKKNGEEV